FGVGLVRYKYYTPKGAIMFFVASHAINITPLKGLPRLVLISCATNIPSLWDYLCCCYYLDFY
ncbi:hypothetical protein JXI42_03480, partial [bacterium]|nr:hypothetical protein [bacterium]